MKTKIPYVSSGKTLNESIKLEMMDIPLSSRTLKPITESSKR
jgi:hypothetical protein